MPKKVITRRQRKAAEAKRQSESQSANGVPVSAGSAVKTATRSAGKQAAVKKAAKAALFQQPPRDRAGPAKNVKTQDKNVSSQKSSLELIGDGNGQQLVNHDSKDGKQTSEPSIDGQGAFSKSLTRRAVAAFTKMQKLSKGFNKKRNFKKQASTVPDALDLSGSQFDENVKTALNGPLANEILNNKSCSCEFCTAVLNQLLSSKKRINEKKACKKGKKLSPPSHLGTASSGRNNIKSNDFKSLELPAEAKFEDTNDSKITPSKRRIIQKLEMKEKRLEKEVIKKIKQLEKQNKIEVTEQLIKKSLAKLQKNRKEIDQEANAEYSNQASPSSGKLDSPTIAKPNISQTLLRRTTRDPTTITKTFNKCPRQTTKLDELKTAVKQLSVDKVETPKPKVIGNTGYFILVGNDEQLSAQIDNLAAQNVLVEDCVVLDPGVADKVEQQLEQIDMNREQILNRMRNKHDMMTKTRRRRLKDA